MMHVVLLLFIFVLLALVVACLEITFRVGRLLVSLVALVLNLILLAAVAIFGRSTGPGPRGALPRGWRGVRR